MFVAVLCLLPVIRGASMPAPPAFVGNVAQSNLPALVPYPQELKMLPLAAATIPHEVLLVVSKELEEDAATIGEDLALLGVIATVVVRGGAGAPGAQEQGIATLTLSLHSFLGSEAYDLSCATNRATSATSTWTLRGGSALGVWWGSRTLLQLWAAGAGAAVPAVAVLDYPRGPPYRSLMIDMAREAFDLQFHLDTIKRLSGLKMSAYHMHVSDDQGYFLPSRVLPNLTSHQGPGYALTELDVAAIVATARAYHVELVPEIDLPGHSAWMTRQLPSLTYPGRCQPGQEFCPIDLSRAGLPNTIRLVTELYREVFELFPHSRYHHLGADEAVTLDPVMSITCDCTPTGTFRDARGATQMAYGDAHCGLLRENQSALGLLAPCFSEMKVGYHKFLNAMAAVVHSANRTAIAWEGFDPAPDATDEVPPVDKRILVQPFDSGHHDGWARTPIDYWNANYSVVNSAWSPLYLAPGGLMTDVEHLGLWDSTLFGGPNAPTTYAQWQRLPADNWWAPNMQAWAGSVDGWPIASQATASGGPPPELPDRLVGAEIALWQIPMVLARWLLFAPNCSTRYPPGTGGGGAGRPQPRVPVMAERAWGSPNSRDDLMARVGCSYAGL